MARLAIRMPKMSMTMTEGEVASWNVKVGDEVAVGDVVCEVMTDKIDMEVESTVAGTLVEIAVETGMAEVGAPIGWVEGEDDGASFGDLLSEPDPEPEPAPPAQADLEPDPAPVVAEPAPEPEARQAEARGITPAVPRARALAREHGVDLDALSGTGPDGLVRMADVEAALPAPAEPAPAPVAAPVALPTQTPAAAPASLDRKASIRAAVARAMTPSAAIPQFTVWREITLDTADAARQGLSWTTVLLRGYAAALRDVPDLLARWEGDRSVDSGPPAVALAVATDRGLLVPVFSEPDTGDAAALDAEIRDVVRAAHTGKLDRRYLGLANGSLSNLGGAGVDRFQALLTPPQASVLSLGAITRRPVAVPGGLGVALTVHAGLTVDHRVADGAHAAELLARLAARLEQPL
ncbi:pyruvate dehydrogenase complex dihydrolipoamide acetyltransferase [Nocardioides aestuarii]|uniref:Dihydrolipoamide acetyltransferase component of pyruvate dehydrogenase complex n=1 Tax=Nocardioides aestuarii TaxID=252231 RepID=A0ABW4TPQ2_9ACTN